MCKLSAVRFPVLLAALVLLGACTSTSTDTTSAPTTSTSVAPTTTTLAPTTTTTVLDVGDGPTGEDLAGAVFSNTLVASFAAHTEVLVSRDADGTQPTVSSTIDTVYQRDPSAVALEIRLNETLFSVVLIDDEAWLNQGGVWEQNPLAEQAVSLASVSLLSPETVGVILPALSDVGEEEVAGRPAVHYQGGAEVFDVLVDVSTDLNLAEFTDLEYATIDIWVDKAGFMSKAEYRFGGTRGEAAFPEYYVATFALTEFDLDTVIVRPSS